MHVRARRSMSERRGDCGFWREALKRKLILGAARAAGRERPLSCAAAATFHRRISRDAAFAASSLLHIVPERRAAAPYQTKAARDGAGSSRVRRNAPLVCERRAFYGLMTFDETGVLRT
ncbi:MAG: hypothetical protein PPHEMADMSA_3754 [uncultured Paraburkholderia sp.]|nr:MAG: hypothetical protein PPHEMADMSA_3754 [uncultured Paraburkholderia sp.]CAH2931939.1 MAG: hypothetical protein PPHERAN_3759 [uncultured Paraburkholderia sp.]